MQGAGLARTTMMAGAADLGEPATGGLIAVDVPFCNVVMPAQERLGSTHRGNKYEPH